MIPDSDLKVIYTRGTGNGGQHRNKVETCCVVTHIPTGISERNQDTRSKIQNFKEAKRRVIARVEAAQAEKAGLAKNEARKEALSVGVIRTYNFQRQEVKDHRTGKRASLKQVLNGDLEKLHH